jgi:hypothetical protein
MCACVRDTVQEAIWNLLASRWLTEYQIFIWCFAHYIFILSTNGMICFHSEFSNFSDEHIQLFPHTKFQTKCPVKFVKSRRMRWVGHITWMGKSKLLYDWQSVSMSWYRAPLWDFAGYVAICVQLYCRCFTVLQWDLRPDIISCRNVAVWNLRSCIYWAPSLTRGRVCNLQCNHLVVRVCQNPKP